MRIAHLRFLTKLGMCRATFLQNTWLVYNEIGGQSTLLLVFGQEFG